MSRCSERWEPKWNLILEIRSTGRHESVRWGGWPTHQTRWIAHGRKENKCGGRSRINWKLANRKCATVSLSLPLSCAYTRIRDISYSFFLSLGRCQRDIHRTRLENKIGTMAEKRVLATASEGHLNGGMPNPRKGSSRWTHEALSLQRRQVCIGPTRQALLSAVVFSSSFCSPFDVVLRNPPTSPADVRARHTRACPFFPLNPVGPRVVRIKKDCLTIRRGSNIALEGALVLCPKPALTVSLPSCPYRPRLRDFGLARPVTLSYGAHDFASWIRT